MASGRCSIRPPCFSAAALAMRTRTRTPTFPSFSPAAAIVTASLSRSRPRARTRCRCAICSSTSLNAWASRPIRSARARGGPGSCKVGSRMSAVGQRACARSADVGRARVLLASRTLAYVVALGFGVFSTSARAAEMPAQKVGSHFVGQYCLECHDAETEKGDREFESFKLPLGSEAQLITAKDIVDQLTLREMPPRKAEAHPTDDERLAIIRVLREGIADARGKIESTAARTVMRRL